MTESSSAARAGFWDRGGFWKAVILATLYVALNFALGLTIGALFADSLDADDLLGDPLTLFLAVMLPTAVQGAVMAFIAWRLGWLRSLFRTQPTTLSRSWWMWILPIAVLVWNVLRLAATDYSRYTFTSIALILLLGLLIGFGEELTTRGLGVTLLRRAGYRELAVAVLSSLVFAAMHLGNIAGMDGLTVGITVFYTFFFGVAMYFTLRVTRNLVWPMLLHATTDPSAMLLTGASTRRPRRRRPPGWPPSPDWRTSW